MRFRLTIMEAPDLTTVRLAGRLGEDAVTPLHDACSQARRPVVLDLSDVTGASEAGVLLLRRLASEGIHLLGASQYVTLLLAAEKPPAIAGSRPRARRPQGPSKQTRLHREEKRP
jgi:hypothetical protein